MEEGNANQMVMIKRLMKALMGAFFLIRMISGFLEVARIGSLNWLLRPLTVAKKEHSLQFCGICSKKIAAMSDRITFSLC